MGNSLTVNKIGFEDMQKVLSDALIISTLPNEKQQCLIQNTISSYNEEKIINNYLSKDKSKLIIIYGENTLDDSVYNKYNQLYKLGFTKIYLYVGGLFEWLLLQDIYGTEEFKTSTYEIDILKYKPTKNL